ncbi:type II toxin-antitoxin system ParD family antitoxin [Aliiglaciecola sp. LCG003]|uniref:type II toxin-antitoxin system ParD family antitoxin n=1 Tax=Aliiglaciecola sp. LCG003 TaxID=3053655 RepID=UPI002572CB0E|nr:type II toxin-antitoxin system ParD family antitoxin [Aliiglaciecola sp. LCG003]WJG08149.1 type II toxin-antitoxin system ParD family antitoxin [Aliiglaciecola sp. LCG003]
MSTIRKTITVTDQQDEWIKAQIVAGRYTNDSEYIRALVRNDQEQNSHDGAIRKALIEGEASGKPQPFEVGAFKARMMAKHG